MKPVTDRALQAEQVKASILEAAITLFGRGFNSVAIQEVARVAGYKHSLVMYHFPTKEQLWEQAARRLMMRFDELYREHVEVGPAPSSDRDRVRSLLLAFAVTLRDLPAYGQILLSEGSNPSERLLWLHKHYFPSAFREMQFEDQRLEEILKRVTLVSTSVSGALLYTIVAAPQIALSAELTGGELPGDIYPISEELANRLADMLTDFVFSQLAAA